MTAETADAMKAPPPLFHYDDGPSFVTLAMNGWADPEPAWWLNLQACADTTVDVADGSRAVRARAAAGPERERPWARLRQYPGWGNEINALAERRSTATAVVVLDPRTTSAHSSQKVG